MAGIFASHVRPGLAKSDGAKHKTVAAAFSDVLDNSRFHGEAMEGATAVTITLGPGANAHLKARTQGARTRAERHARTEHKLCARESAHRRVRSAGAPCT